MKRNAPSAITMTAHRSASGIPLKVLIFLALVPTLVVLMALLYVVTTRQDDIRQECQRMLWTSFPELMEQQRSSMNLERLRMLGNTVYNSSDAGARRKARIEAQALSTDAVFESSEQVREIIAQAFKKLHQMASLRDRQRDTRSELCAILGRLELVQTELMSALLESPKTSSAWPLDNVIVTFLELLNVHDVRNAIVGEDNLHMLIAKLGGLEAQAKQAHLPERVQNAYKSLQQEAYQFLQVYKEYFAAEKTLGGLWQEFDIALRSLSERITMNAATGIESMLQNSIAMAMEVERVTWQGFMLLCVTVLAGLFLVRNFVCLPLLWLIRAINSIRDGQGLLSVPRIFVNELRYVADSITNLHFYWTGVKAHSVQLESEKHLLEGLSIKDGLTDLYNRRYFDLMLHAMWDESRTTGKSVALLMMDIDHFKNYNDALGHPKGDTCLKKLAMAFTANILRPTDKVCRYGGEEFALLLHCDTITGALRVAERIHQGVQGLGLEHPASEVSPLVTLSIGVVIHVPQEGDSSSMLVEWADRALYAAKKAGRNRTYVCNLHKDTEGAWVENLEEGVDDDNSPA